MPKSALVILHNGFEEIEAVNPIDILRRGGIEVTTAAQEDDLAVKGRNGMTLLADTYLSQVLEQSYDAVVLPGGPGIPQNVRGDDRVATLLKKQYETGKLTAAICAAPLVLKDAGVLPGIAFTAHFSAKEELPELDESKAVIKEGNLITSRGAGTATAFGLAILAALTDADTADAVAESICLMQTQ